MEETLPRPLARYLLLEELASGGMARVYLAHLAGPAGFSRLVAVKCLHAQYANDPEFRDMLFDEARLVATIRHPNVVPILDVLADTQPVALVMEYVQGVTLARLARLERARGTKMPIPVVAQIVCDLLEGLHAAHEARSEAGERLGIVHRDVSPQNVMVDTGGVGRVLDFGIAKAEGRTSVTEDGRVKGKAGYMAPEQMRGKTVDRRTDVFAAGIVLWELLSGERYAAGDNAMASMIRILEGKPTPPSGARAEVPAAMDAVVMKALAREPDERFATAREMADALEACGPLARKRDVATWMRELASQDLSERAQREESAQSRATELSRAGATAGGVPVGKRLLLGGLLVFVLGGVLGARYLGRRAPSSDAASAESASSAAATSPSTSLTAPAPASAASASASMSAEPAASAIPSGAPRARPKRTPRCSPPYTVRSDGIHVPKPECF